MAVSWAGAPTLHLIDYNKFADPGCVETPTQGRHPLGLLSVETDFPLDAGPVTSCSPSRLFARWSHRVRAKSRSTTRLRLPCHEA